MGTGLKNQAGYPLHFYYAFCKIILNMNPDLRIGANRIRILRIYYMMLLPSLSLPL